MTKLKKLDRLYREGGMEAVCKEIQNYLFVDPWGPKSKRLLGAQLHQKLLMYTRLGYWPQIKEPRTFNEKILHRKLYTNDGRFSTIENKWGVRDYVSERVGKEVLPEVYHVTDDPETIPFDSLPKEFVIKPTHMSGPVIIINENDGIDVDSVKEECHRWLKKSYGNLKEEYWYSEIKHRVMVEERLYGTESDIPRDFKFFVFHGSVEYVQIDFDRYSNHTRRFYDKDWNPLDFELKFPLGPETSEPEKFVEMIDIAEALGDGFDFIRVDLYQTESKRVVFGEMTVAPGSGGEQFRPVNYDFKLGLLW